MVTDGLGCEFLFHKSEHKAYDRVVLMTKLKSKTYQILSFGFSGEGLQKCHFLPVVL